MQMVKRVIAGAAVAAVSFGVMAGTASAAQGPDSKHAFPVECQTGTLAGETVIALNGKRAYLEDGTELKVTAFHFEFGDKVKDKEFGNVEGTMTCGGTEVTPEGTFTFLATLREA